VAFPTLTSNFSPGRFEFTTSGTGVVGYAGAALLGELADRLEHVGWG
jgi:hypothetical protein